MARGGKKGGKTAKVAKAGVKREAGYLYYLDKQGDISRSVMNRGGTKKKAKKKTKTVVKKTVKKIVKKAAKKAVKKAVKKSKKK
jgi:hypothetical protein